jgi:hypothetical protein
LNTGLPHGSTETAGQANSQAPAAQGCILGRILSIGDMPVAPQQTVVDAADAIMHHTFGNIARLRDALQTLQVQPRVFSGAEPGVSVFAAEPANHQSGHTFIHTLMMSGAHSAALTLHNLACTVDPVPQWSAGEEFFGTAFFSEGTTDSEAVDRLRNALDELAGVLVSRSSRFVSQRPWIEFVHQIVEPAPAPMAEDPDAFLPLEVFRIRYRGLTPCQFEELLAGALQAVAGVPAPGGDPEGDLLVLTLSGPDMEG